MLDIKNIKSGLMLDGRYKLLRPLNSDGGTADVWLALDTNTIDEMFDDDRDELTSVDDSGIKVAIKIYRPKNALDLGEQRFREEFKIVFNCHHTNLVQPINFSIFEGVPYLVLPFCQNGSSETLKGKFHDRHDLWKYIFDVSSGLAYLHAFNPTIVHHDIKPANVLIDDNKNYAITDFGISAHRGLNRDGYEESQSGTMAYMAPERFLDGYESAPESDIWSFGATLYEIITGEVPFGEEGGSAQLERKIESPVISQNIPSEVKKLIADCLSLDPAKRPSAEEIRRAAESGHYPPRSLKKNLITAGVALVATIALLIAFLPKSQSQAPEPAPVEVLSNDEVFNKTLPLLDSSDPEELKAGLAVMDSLSALGYVPAIYEEALTYGWYDEERSVKRKKILGIETNNYLPKSLNVNNKAIAYLTKIEEISDPKYPDQNAQALYRLAVYYGNDSVLKKDVGKAEKLLEKSRAWAEKSGNETLTSKISAILNKIKKQQ